MALFFCVRAISSSISLMRSTIPMVVLGWRGHGGEEGGLVPDWVGLWGGWGSGELQGRAKGRRAPRSRKAERLGGMHVCVVPRVRVAAWVV